MLFTNFRDEWNNVGFRRISLPVEVLSCRNDDIDHVWKAATTTPALVHLVINAGRGDECPRVFLQKTKDCLFNFQFCDKITAANKHGTILSPTWYTFNNRYYYDNSIQEFNI